VQEGMTGKMLVPPMLSTTRHRMYEVESQVAMSDGDIRDQCSFRSVILLSSRDASEAKLGLPSEAEEASGCLTVTTAH